MGSSRAFILWGSCFLGAGLLGGYYVGAHQRPAAPTHGDLPAWVARARHVGEFTSVVSRSQSPPDGDASGRLRSMFGLGEGRAVAHADWRLTRVLQQGFEFDSLLRIEAASGPEPDSGTLWLRVSRGAREVATYRADVQAARVRLLHGKPGEELQEAAPEDTATPLSIGDVRLQDVIDGRRALQADRLQWRGTLANLNAEPLSVFDLVLDPEGAAAALATPREAARQAKSDLDARGVLMLLYCGENLTPRSLRVFDRAGRLVRTYSNLRFEDKRKGESGPSRRLVQFNVDSAATDSRSYLLLDAISFEPPARGTPGDHDNSRGIR